MRVFSDIPDLRAHLRDPVATIGNFDGLHRGHRAIIERVLARARATGGSSLLVTFEPHPLTILAPDRAPRMITTRRQKLALLEEAGLEFVLILPFTMELASVDAASFVKGYLADGLGVREVYVGANFNFGRGREGNADLLVALCADLRIRAEKVPEVLSLGSPISSSSHPGVMSVLAGFSTSLRIWSPIAVPPGSRVRVCSIPRSSRWFESIWICVVLPEPSIPSKVMNRPKVGNSGGSRGRETGPVRGQE